MTPEQELTAMIEDEMYQQIYRWCSRQVGSQIASSFQQADDAGQMEELPTPDRQQAMLSRLYWLATDPDDMVH